MKKLLIITLLTIFCCNNAFAELTSFQEKLGKLDKITDTNSFTPKQAQSFLRVMEGFTDCSPSSNGHGYICLTSDLMCLININVTNNKAEINCLDESDLDKLLL